MKPDPNLISVIIPCFNLGAFVGEAIESVLAQEGVSLEVLLVDDGSTDGETVRVLEGWRRGGRVRFFRTPNRGVAAARNLGLDAGRGEYCCFLDADDRLEPDALRLMAEALRESPEAVLAYPSGYRFGLVEAEQWRPRFNRLRLLTACTLPVPALIRKAMVGDCRFRSTPRGFEYEDWDFFIQVTRRGQAVHVPLARYGYRERADSRVDRGLAHHDQVIQDLRRFNAEDFSPAALMESKRRWAPAVTIMTRDGPGREAWKDILEGRPGLDAQLPAREAENVGYGARGKYVLRCEGDALADAELLNRIIVEMEGGRGLPPLPEGWRIAPAQGLGGGLDPVEDMAGLWAKTDDPSLWAELDEKLWRLTLPAWTQEKLPADLDELAGVPRRLEGVFQRMGRAKIGSYALFGAGKHPRYLIRKGWLRPLPKVIFDDHPQVAHLGGVPVLRPGSETPRGVDALLVCSDSLERVLYRRARDISGGRLPVLRIYT